MFIFLVVFEFCLCVFDFGDRYVMRTMRGDDSEYTPRNSFGGDVLQCFYLMTDEPSYSPNNIPCARYESTIFRNFSSSEYYIYGGRRTAQDYFYQELWMFNPETEYFKLMKGSVLGYEDGYFYPNFNQFTPSISNVFEEDSLPVSGAGHVVLFDDADHTIFGFGLILRDDDDSEGTLVTVSTIYEYCKHQNMFRLIPTQDEYTTELYISDLEMDALKNTWIDNGFLSSRMYSTVFPSANFPELSYMYGGHCTSPTCQSALLIHDEVYMDFYCFNSSSYEFLLIENAVASYGSKNVPSETNFPGPRYGSAVFTHDQYAYVFGGSALSGYLNDLWRFDMSNENFTAEHYYDGNGIWTWIGGSNVVGSSDDSIGVEDSFSSFNYPGSLRMFKSWSTENYGVFISEQQSQYTLTKNEIWIFEFSTLSWQYIYSLYELNRAYWLQGEVVPDNIITPRSGVSVLSDGSSETVYFYGGFNFFRIHNEDCALEISPIAFGHMVELSVQKPTCSNILSNNTDVCSSSGRCVQPDLCLCDSGKKGEFCSEETSDIYEKYYSEYDVDKCDGIDKVKTVTMVIISFALPFLLVLVCFLAFSTGVIIYNANDRSFLKDTKVEKIVNKSKKAIKSRKVKEVANAMKDPKTIKNKIKRIVKKEQNF